jgi:uncharacterized protein (DUF2141 family)
MYAVPYSPVKFMVQKYIYTGQEDTRRGTLNVHITGLKPGGAVYAVLYDRQSLFWKGPLAETELPYRFEYVLVEEGEMTYTFDSLEYGEYVLVLMHDENTNHSIDFDEEGKIPVEGMFILDIDQAGIPSTLEDFNFDELKFTFDQPEQTIQARMLYPPFR